MKNLLSALTGLLKGEGHTTPGLEVLPAQEFQARLQAATKPQLVDVRSPQEFRSGYLPGAQLMNIQVADFLEQVKQLDPDQPVFLYCRSGRRSAMAAAKLSRLGFTQLFDLKGGINSWASQGLPIQQG